ncbi:hypothetical protein B484DRAFT_401287 [Ochromonadaceae sp. CCMP2298]|nr:hypothetical protein B484DRAFT_401287 [Ochromonadaceae sp. CCMP2298]
MKSNMKTNLHSVKATTHISFDEEFKTFRLLTGTSLYTFCIGPELTLEHLYWGVMLEGGYDLRYISQSSRNAHFNTVEATSTSTSTFEGKIVVEAETLEEVQKTWKENSSLGTRSVDDITLLQRKRMENYSWRILSQACQARREGRGGLGGAVTPTASASKLRPSPANAISSRTRYKPTAFC